MSARALLVAACALALLGCESTQSKSARLEREAQTRKQERGLVVQEEARDVEVGDTAVVQDGNGAAAVVEVRNASRRSLVGVPLSVEVLDAASKPVYANDAPGLDASLVSVASLAGGERVAWVNDQVTLSGEGESVVAKVGTGGKPGPARLPRLEVSGLAVETDAAGDVAIAGDVANRSDVEQRKLVVHVVGRRDGEVVAAGRAIVERLAAGRSAHFSAFPIGDPRGAELSAAAPPTVVAP